MHFNKADFTLLIYLIFLGQGFNVSCLYVRRSFELAFIYLPMTYCCP